MRYRFIRDHRGQFRVSVMCRVLEVSTSGYYDWEGRSPSERDRSNAELLEAIKGIHAASRRVYGVRRVHWSLVCDGRTCGRNRVARLMRDAGISARRKRRHVRTTDSRHGFRVAPNLLDRNFRVEAPNAVWVSDITYVPTDEGWLYLATVVDLYSRRIVGYSMDSGITRKLTIDALEMAIHQRKPDRGLMHHSDRGSQYASNDYQEMLKAHGMVCSMSRKGDCWDNAVAESFYSTLKCELIHQGHFATREEARREIFEYIEVFYNRKRIHSSLGYNTPAGHELAAKAA